MEKLVISDIPEMFDHVGQVFAERKDELCAMKSCYLRFFC